MGALPNVSMAKYGHDAAFRVVSNYTELETQPTLADALLVALDESRRFDDRVTVERGGVPAYLAVHGQLYRLTPERGPIR